MNNREKLKEIVEALEMGFTTQTVYSANVTLDQIVKEDRLKIGDKKLPLAILIYPQSGRLMTGTILQDVRNVPTARIVIVDTMTTPESFNEDEADIADALMDKAKRLFNAVNKSGLWKTVTNATYNMLLHVFDANMCAVELIMQLEELEGECYD